MFIVYVLKSETTGKIYIGQTDNLSKRLQQHNDFKLDKTSYTKKQGKNWDVVYKEEFQTREEVLRREKELKSHRGRDWLKSILPGL